MIMGTYSGEIFGITLIIIALLLFMGIRLFRKNVELDMQNRRYETLSLISNECIYKYFVKDDYLKMSDKFVEMFGNTATLKKINSVVKNELVKLCAKQIAEQ